MLNYKKSVYIFIFILFVSGTISINLYFVKIVNAGGPTTTLSHTNDKPDSYALCSAHTSDPHSVGVLSNGLWMPRVVTDSPWLTLLNSESTQGNGFVQYRLDKNFSPFSRAAVIVIGSSQFTVVQDGFDETKPCPAETNLSDIRASSAGGNFGLTINDHGLDQDWQIENAPLEWLWIGQSTGRGYGETSIGISTNSSPENRMTTITVAGKTIPIIQGGGSR
ncbi:MAG TPA: hypothetical protein PKY59_19020 [Pyrinomonadaceae bacterium]|nr:hypothetical protein [Pyrinomonadaceae bacterium]